MLQFFRSFMKSKFGVVVTLAVLGLIALAFGLADVTGNSTFGGVAGGDRAAVVGDRRISTSELSTAVTNNFNEVRQQNPTLSLAAFIAEGGVARTLDQLIGRTALSEFGRENGLRAGKRLVDSELTNAPAFQGPSGG
jgi:peptidyl-prolyl cis-trans isomerase D